MSAAEGLLIGIGLLILAAVVGELLARRHSGGVSVYGNFSQAVGGLLYFLIFGGLLLLGGPWRIVAFVFAAFGFAMFRVKGSEVADETNLRQKVNG